MASPHYAKVHRNLSTKLPWKVAWVTGASSGIGADVACQLAESGVRVAVSSRSQPTYLPRPNIHFFPIDVTEPDQVGNGVRKIEDALGPIDIAIFAAASYEPFDAVGVSADIFERINRTNYTGVTACISAVAKPMLARGHGHISWFASVAGYRGLPKAAYYAPTKAALINLAECLKLDFEPRGIAISVINPGFVATPMTAVNDFKMPFLMNSVDAARATIKGLARRRFEIAYPFTFVMILKLLRILPYRAYFAITRLTRS